MNATTIGLAFVAGLLSTLSPCVLPLLPIVVGTAASRHRYGPVALAAGLAVSFTAIGLFVATVGFAIGLDAGVFRLVAALLLIAIGIVLAVPHLQESLAVAAGPVGAWAGNRLGGTAAGNDSGLTGQLGVGLLLGAVWSPCAGPTLGAASVLAAQGQALGSVALTMLVFGIGAALPLLVIGTLSREAAMRLRGRLMNAGGGLRLALGVMLLMFGLAILTGWDKRVETWLLEASPEWLTRLTTSI